MWWCSPWINMWCRNFNFPAFNFCLFYEMLMQKICLTWNRDTQFKNRISEHTQWLKSIRGSNFLCYLPLYTFRDSRNLMKSWIQRTDLLCCWIFVRINSRQCYAKGRGGKLSTWQLGKRTKVHRQMSRNHSAPGQIHLREAIGHIWPQTLSICCAGSPCKIERVISGSWLLNSDT